MSGASDDRIVSEVLLDYLYSEEDETSEDLTLRDEAFAIPPEERLTQPSDWSQAFNEAQTLEPESSTGAEAESGVYHRDPRAEYVPFGPFSRATIHPDGKVYWHFRAKDVQCDA